MNCEGYGVYVAGHGFAPVAVFVYADQANEWAASKYPSRSRVEAVRWANLKLPPAVPPIRPDEPDPHEPVAVPQPGA